VVLERRPRPEVLAEPVDGEGVDDPAVGAVDEDGEATADAALDAAREAAETSGADDEADAVRWLRLLTWGLVPSWAKDRSVGYKMINARAETLLDRTHRRAALTRRCLVPADGWYEWQKSPTVHDAKGRPRKQPFWIHPMLDEPMAFAGIYEFWRDPAAHRDDPAAWLTTYAVITTDAESELRAIHDRMPFVMPADRWDDWLDPQVQDADAVRALLSPPPAGRFAAVPVSTRVNSVANNGAVLLEPAPPGSLQGVLDPATGELIGGGDALF
jgi:putative SOS response-associated peptidase YedK